ncbi:hypothetical protein [Mycetocola spongiae]|uniref:hypothetical protein n=1 Tax=Mycetocola spongiae TaxID=2859226 RepID=UPI001CF39C51|nr:hypothetical protein [Mycetocola spongiae]UCR89717.1 hypothetical protein KXZ72_03305 [Mycetocola spongiae]
MSTVAAVVALTGDAIVVAAPAHAGIHLYDHAYYGGYRGDQGRGPTPYMGDDANDRSSSPRVTSPARSTILSKDRNYGGRRPVESYIGTDHLGTYGYDVNDKTSSLR